MGAVPEAPTPMAFGTITPDSIQYRFHGNGSDTPIREWQVHYGLRLDYGEFATSSNGATPIGALQPGLIYYFWSRGRNDAGWGPFSRRTSIRTLRGGARIKINGVWKTVIPYIKVNGVWKVAAPYIKVNGVWKPGS